MIKKITMCIMLVYTAIIAYAQSGNIAGTLKTADGKPAEFVNVGLKGFAISTTTDADGNFKLTNVTPGTYTLVVSYTGIQPQEQTVEVKDGETTNVDIAIAESVKELQAIDITGKANRYNEKNVSQSMRINAPLIEIPQNIQVVNTETLKDQQVISMSDGLVRNVSGLIRAEHWGDMYTNITARGSQIQAFRNGFNVVNSYWGPLTEDMSFVERIEFVKGPAGFMISNGDPAGLYNVVTKKPTGQTKGEATITMGSYDLYRGALDLDGKLSNNGKLLYRLNLAAQNKGSFRPNEYNDRYVVAPVISYQVDPKTKLTFEYTYQRANMSDVGSYYIFSPFGFADLPRNSTTMPAGLPGTKINDHSTFLTLQHDINKNWKVTAQGSLFLNDQVGSSMWPYSVNTTDGTIIRSVGSWDAKSKMNLGQVFINGDVTTGPIRHRILGGIDMAKKEYMADWGQTHLLDDTSAGGKPFDPEYPDLGVPANGYPNFDRATPLIQRATMSGGIQKTAYTSLYLQDELGFFNNIVRLTLAGRYTDISQYYFGTTKAQHFTPRVGLSVSVTKNTSVYALYDQAFIPQSGIIRGGKKVRPITGNSMEVGIKRDWFDGRWNTTIAAYRIIKNNELVTDVNANVEEGVNGVYSMPLGQKTTQGIEFDLRGTIVKGLDLVANYALTDSRITKINSDVVTTMKVGDRVPPFAKHTMNGWLTYRIQGGALKGFGVSAGCTYLVDRATYWEKSPDPNINLADYFKVDGGVSWENAKLKITTNVFNVLDAVLYSGTYGGSYYGYYYYQYESPRNVRVSVGYKF